MNNDLNCVTGCVNTWHLESEWNCISHTCLSQLCDTWDSICSSTGSIDFVSQRLFIFLFFYFFLQPLIYDWLPSRESSVSWALLLASQKVSSEPDWTNWIESSFKFKTIPLINKIRPLSSCLTPILLTPPPVRDHSDLLSVCLLWCSHKARNDDLCADAFVSFIILFFETIVDSQPFMKQYRKIPSALHPVSPSSDIFIKQYNITF